MALDFHNADTNEYLFGLNDSQYANLDVIFVTFKNKSGVFIDPYRDTKLSVVNQKAIIQIIEVYINKNDLNANKQQTIDILEFCTLMKYFSSKEMDLKTQGD